MQNVEYTIEPSECPVPLFLWRAIPARITVAGVEDPAGEWTFLLGNDWNGETLLSGSVTREGTDLVVTLENMDSAPLTEAIRGEETLACTATLTDSSSQVYLFPLFIRNRAVNASPAASGTTSGAAVTPESIGAVSVEGLALEELTSGSIPDPGKVYSFAPAGAVTMTFPTPAAGKTNAFQLRIIMPTPAVAVTWPAGLVWRFAIPALAAGTTTELGFAWTGENWEGWAVPDLSEYARLSGGNTFSGDQILGGGLNAAGKIMQGYGPGSAQWSDAPGNSVSLGSACATGSYAVAAGKGSIARGEACMTVGVSCTVNASGQGAVCVGNYCSTNRPCSFVAGNYCAAYDTAQLVTGQYNELVSGARVTGNGSGNNARRNIEVLDWQGNLTIAGDLAFTPAGAEAPTTLAALIARIEALEQAIR